MLFEVSHLNSFLLENVNSINSNWSGVAKIFQTMLMKLLKRPVLVLEYFVEYKKSSGC